MRFRTVVPALGLTVVLVGCSTGSGSTTFDYDCPEGDLTVSVLLDVSASGRNEIIMEERLNSLQVSAEKAADCDASFVAIAWSGSSSSSKTLFSGEIPIAGATEIGRDRKIPGAVKKVMSEVRDNLSTALKEIPGDKSDFLGALYLLNDIVASRGSADAVVEADLLTDAISTGGNARINDPGLTAERVRAVVEAQTLPSLEGVAINVRGVGRVAGVTPPPQDFIQLVQEYASGMCERTGAECSVFTTVLAS